MAAPLLQSYGPGNVDELLTTSMVNLMPGIRDNVFSSNPALKYFYKTNKIKKRGGAALSHGVLYSANSTAQEYERYDTIDVTPQDGATRDQWEWAQYAVSIAVDGFTERVANAGDSKLEDIVDMKKMQAEESLSLLLEQDFFNASPNSKKIRSLATIILGSGTEGGINGSTSVWWQSQIKSSGSFTAQGVSDLRNLCNTIAVKNPAGLPTFLLSDQTSLEAYEGVIVPQERYTDLAMGDLGIRALKFKETPWMWSPQATSGVIYALHDSAIEFVVNSDTDFELTPFVKPANQDARVAQILLACALMTGNRRKLGKMTGVTA